MMMMMMIIIIIIIITLSALYLKNVLKLLTVRVGTLRYSACMGYK